MMGCTIFLSVSLAQSVLPYETRTQSFTGLGSYIRGDIRTLGIAGATLALPIGLSSTFENPANSVMILYGSGLGISSNTIRDNFIQDSDDSLTTTTLAVGGRVYPYGFSLGYWVPWNEGQTYVTNSGNDRVFAEVFSREWNFTFSHLFVDNKLSLGASIRIGKGVRVLQFIDNESLTRQFSSYAFGVTLGGIYQIEDRILLGATFSSPLSYSGDEDTNTTQGIVGFFQEIKTPWTLGIGLGWIPNRIFQAGFSFIITGPHSNVALLSDQNRSVGESISVQPRLGASYKFLEYQELEAFFSSGLYLEFIRYDGAPVRPHFTTALEFEPWIFNIGWGIDVASNYRNFIFQLGINVIEVSRKLKLIPDEWEPENVGLLPNPTIYKEEGLPRPYVKDWVERDEEGLLEIGRKFPGRLEKRLIDAKESFEEFTDDIGNVLGGDEEGSKSKDSKKTTRPKVKKGKR